MQSSEPAGRRKTGSSFTADTSSQCILQSLKSRSRKTSVRRLFALPLLLILLILLTKSPIPLVIPPPNQINEAPKLQSFHSLSSAPANMSELNNQITELNTNPHKLHNSPYHNWELFAANYEEMQQNLKIFVYPDVYNTSSPFAKIFVPYINSILFNSNSASEIGNYFSEHAFKAALLKSSLITTRPQLAHIFFMPFSINALRNDRRLRSETSISEFVAEYVGRISTEFEFWNASGGADHFYAYCHSVGREAASKHWGLYNNAIQVTCSSSYFQRFFVAHKDVGLPQVWSRADYPTINPPNSRSRLVFFAGRVQNSNIRREFLALWSNDTAMDIYSGNPPFPYEQGFKQSKYCLHVKGYEVNTARISDAIHYGCIPVLLSNYYDLPFANILDWSKFSIIINQVDLVSLKKILLSVPSETYESIYQNLQLVRRHFRWHETPVSYDSFYMTAYQLWLRRGLQRIINCSQSTETKGQ